MAPDYAAGQEVVDGFTAAYEEGGGTVAGQALTPFGTTQDYQPFLSPIQSSGAEATFVFYSGGEAVSYVQQYAEFGLKDTIPLYGSGFLTEGSVLDAQGEAAVGVQTTLHYSTEIENEANEAFVAAYQEAYDELPTVFGMTTYDTANVLDRGPGGRRGSQRRRTLGGARRPRRDRGQPARPVELQRPDPRADHLPARGDRRGRHADQQRRRGPRRVRTAARLTACAASVVVPRCRRSGGGGEPERRHGPVIGWFDANLVSILNGFAIGSLLFILAVGLSIVFGMMDVLNLAHGAFFLIGSYLAVTFAAGDSWGGFLTALGVAALVGLLAGGALSGHDRAAGPPADPRSGATHARASR